jgi:hypothetical protein
MKGRRMERMMPHLCRRKETQGDFRSPKEEEGRGSRDYKKA